MLHGEERVTLNASWLLKIATVNTGGQLIMGQACMIQCINPIILTPPLWGRYNIFHVSSTHEETEAQDAQPVAKDDTVSVWVCGGGAGGAQIQV